MVACVLAITAIVDHLVGALDLDRAPTPERRPWASDDAFGPFPTSDGTPDAPGQAPRPAVRQ